MMSNSIITFRISLEEGKGMVGDELDNNNYLFIKGIFLFGGDFLFGFII